MYTVYMPKDDKPKHVYTRDKDGILIEVTDPIQDIMSEDEIDTASDRFMSLLEEDEKDSK